MTAGAQTTVAVVGTGISGLACVRHLLGRGDTRVILLDTRQQPPHAARVHSEFPGVETHFGDLSRRLFDDVDRVLLSPGLTPDVLPDLPADLPVVGELALFAEAAQAPVAGITGTNGKSTVTVLTGHVLRELGFRVAVGGNLGTPMLDLIDPDVDAYVLELSSFQLERPGAFRADVGAVLNVAPDHLDRYRSLDDYVLTKQRVYTGARVAVFNRDDARTGPLPGAPRQVSFGAALASGSDYGIRHDGGTSWLCRGQQPLLDCARLRIRGQHNFRNALAALAIAEQLGADPQAAATALATCEGLPHRCEVIGQVAGTEAINDSKATNPGACIAALEGLDPGDEQRIVLIAGGQGKGLDYRCLRDPIARHVRALVLIGAETEALQDTLGDVVEVRRAQDLCAATGVAFALARAGECVLLSPACASFDQFDNFEARGETFRRAVSCLMR